MHLDDSRVNETRVERADDEYLDVPGSSWGAAPVDWGHMDVQVLIF